MLHMPNSSCVGVLENGFGSSPFLPHVRREIDRNNFDEPPRRKWENQDPLTVSPKVKSWKFKLSTPIVDIITGQNI
jgi:hypothetical protein